MRVIVCGAGQVGSTIARHLATEGIDVTVVDISPEQARRADESYDVRGMVGHASHPEVLERAGARDADMLIAVTRSDEVNMVACQVAYSLFNVRRRIARVRHHGYLEPIWQGLYAADQLPIDVIISPEVEVANGIVRRLKTPGAFDTVALADGRVQLLGIHCNTGGCSLVGRRMKELSSRPAAPVSSSASSCAMVMPSCRGPRIRCSRATTSTSSPRRRAWTASWRFLGHEEQVARRIVIVGGGNVGLNLANRIARHAPYVSLKMIEHSRERAEYISRELRDAAVVLQGDALDKEVLVEANVQSAETIIAVTNDDETNIFASVLAKREGCARAITLVNKTSYEHVLPTLGHRCGRQPDAITISTILRHVRHRSISALYTLREDFGEVIEATAQEGSRLVRGTLREAGMPDGMLIGAIVRNGRGDHSDQLDPGPSRRPHHRRRDLSGPAQGRGDPGRPID